MIRTILLLYLAAVVATAQVPPTTPVPPTGQPQQNPEQEAEPKKPGRVEGAVLLAGSDAPIRKAIVSLFGRDVRVPFHAVTGENGTFVFEKVLPGDYSFSARHTRYVPVGQGGEYGLFGARKISVSEGEVVKGVVFKMMPGAVVTGTVYDEYGDPQPAARVRLQRFRYRDGKKEMMPANGDSTDDRGVYRIFNIPPGKYYLSAQYEVRSWGRNVPQIEGDDSSYPPVYYPGVLEADTAMELDLRANEERQSMDIRLVLDRALRVKGRVMEGGKPAREAMVMVIKTGSIGYQRTKNQRSDPRTGEFEFSGIQPGTYSLIAMKMTSEPGNRLQGRAKVQVVSSNVEGVVITLGSGMEIPGQVVMEAEGAPVDFAERLVHVMLSPVERTPFGAGGRGAVKPDRSFKLADVPAGRYRLSVRPLPDGSYVAGTVFGNQDVYGQEFEIVDGAQGPLTVRIRMTAATIGGVVEDEDGQPLPNVRVLLAPESPKRDRRELFATDSTDQYGNFSFKNIAPGEYKVWAMEKLEYGRHIDPDFLAVIEDDGEKVEADDNGSYTLKLKLTEAVDN